jgi:hypothetical protein
LERGAYQQPCRELPHGLSGFPRRPRRQT